MFKKFLNFNLFISLIFLMTVLFPTPLFSYEKTHYKPGQYSEDEKVNESLGYEPVIFKKTRCPRCGMEFYYIPGKESPHAHWVHYEIHRQKISRKTGEEIEEHKKEDETEEESLISLFKYKKKKDVDKINSLLSEKDKKSSDDIDQIDMLEGPEYELRQSLTCPYDGYSFFPESEVIEDRKLMQTSFTIESPSVIERSFSKSIPFGVSRELKQFGYDLFDISEQQEKKDVSEDSAKERETLGALGILKTAFLTNSGSPMLSFQAASQTAVVPISPEYVVGPGDTLVINIWGSVQESFPVEVDREGKIMLPKAGPLYVWGLKLKELETRIKQRLDKYYTNFYMDLSMGKLRDIQVYVMGEVRKPGRYNLNSQASIFQALFASGGPTKLGSLRKIRHIHTDGKVEEVDLYPFLLQGKMISPDRIQSGDTIFVPAIGDVVAIAGNVKRPGIYETRSGIPLQDLFVFSGGVVPTGDLQRLQIERIQDNERRAMFDIELKRMDTGEFSFQDVSIRDGDLVIVSPIVRLKHDFVSIIGNVERPGDYALTKDMNIGDLIKRAKGFLPGTYLIRAEIARVTKDRTREIIPVNLNSMMLGEEEDISLNEWDILLIYSESQVQPPSFVEVEGAVNRAGKYELTPNMKVSDLIFRAGGVKSGEVIRGAELFHIMPGEQPVVRGIGIRQVADTNIILDKDIILRAGDALFIKSEPRLTERKVITIKGEVNFPGPYSAREGERLSSLIERAGGFTEDAFLDGVVFNRKSIKEAQEKMRERFIEKENKTILEEQQSILLRKEAGLDKGMISESMKMRREMLDFIESVEIEGRMVVNIGSLAQLKDSKYDVLLEDGDVLAVPQPPSAITVIGSVNNPIAVRFEPNKGVEYYIRRTGGLTKHADKAGIYVIKANGEAFGKFMMSKRIGRGDTIVVPQEFKYWTPPGQLLRDTVEILSRVAIGIGIIAALD